MARKKKSSNSVVHVVLDRSGSMMAIKDDTIGAFNQYLNKLVADEPNARFSLTIFDSQSVDTIVDDEIASEVAPLTADTYQPRGMTPLYDAVGKVIDKLENSAGKNKVLVIITDGQENCSHEFSRDGIKKSLNEKQEKKNWLVLFLAANQDAFEEGAKFGTQMHNTMNFNPSNMSASFAAAYGATSRYLKSGNRAAAAFTTEEREEALAD